MFVRSATALALIAAMATPVMAQSDIVCDAGAVTKAEQEIGQISDGAKKIEATKELTMAKEALAANDLEKCKSHLGNAAKGKDAM